MKHVIPAGLGMRVVQCKREVYCLHNGDIYARGNGDWNKSELPQDVHIKYGDELHRRSKGTTMDEKLVRSSIIYNVVHGSRAYGTNRPDSDYDEKGIAVIKDPRYYFGFKKFEQKDSGWRDGNDRCIYDLRKFFRLALKCNPNIIEVLYVDRQHVLQSNVSGEAIRGTRDMFLSKLAAKTFGGYAVAQLKRLQNKMKAKDGEINWKHASHLVRLLRMGREILLEGKVIVKRHDADQLLRIRRGEVDYALIVEWAEQGLKDLDTALDKSSLPAGPDTDKAEKLMMEIYRRELGIRRV